MSFSFPGRARHSMRTKPRRVTTFTASVRLVTPSLVVIIEVDVATDRLTALPRAVV